MARTTSPSLLLRIRDPQDHCAWHEFDELYSEIIRLYCRQRKLQSHDEDDIVQDVMNSVTQAIRNFDYDPSKGRFRAWLGTITANRIRNHFSRKLGKNDVGLGGEDGTDLMQQWEDPDDSWVEIFSERIFRKASSQVQSEVSKLCWDCFESTWIRNEDSADVASRLQIPIHRVYVNKSRVLKQLDRQIRLLAEDLPVAQDDEKSNPQE